MDISGLTSAYSQYAENLSGNAKAEALNNKVSGADYSKATDEELMEVCKEFEAYFLEQMYKEMMKTIPESEMTSSANSTLVNYYKDEMIKEVSAQTAKQSNMGLAQSLYEQMKRNYQVLFCLYHFV